MARKNGSCTLLKLFALSVFIMLMVSINVYGRDERAKMTLPSTAIKTDSADWKKVVEAARKEGKIVIAGVPGEEWRRSMVDGFQQEYPDIKVEYVATPGRNFWPRIRRERELGKKLWDLYSGGIGSAWEPKRDGYFTPLRPLLLPEIADDSKWIGGVNMLFVDTERKYLLGYLLYFQPSVFVNRDFIKESELKHSEQLLDQKFRSKIVITTPTAGSSRISLVHLAFTYGESFLRELLSKQNVTITDDNRQQVEWLVRGKYPIAIGFSLTLLIPFEKQGLGKNVVGLEDKIVKFTTGSGIISIFEGAPHPNAVKVYVNWLLSQKAQNALSKNVGHNSRRSDVPPVEAVVDRAKLSKYYEVGTEEVEAINERFLPVIKEALKK